MHLTLIGNTLTRLNPGPGLRGWPLFLILALHSMAIAPWPALSAADKPQLKRKEIEFFETRIRPILVEKCYSCHSTSAEKIKGGLKVDSPAALLKGGESGPALVPGSPDKSRMMVAVRYSDPDLRMPPKEPLSADQIAALEEWITLGAPDPRGEDRVTTPPTEHWAFKPIQPATRPAGDAGFIDRHLLGALQPKGLGFSPPAHPEHLLRRLTHDLTGLPPSPEDLAAFLKAPSSSAYEQAVDRLLSSPQFGERWARHWLDVVRYADSNGSDANLAYRQAWRYRDYVIEAYNKDIPYDRFIREQLAGDLLPASNQQDAHRQRIATGFLAIGAKPLGEPDQEKRLLQVIDDQIDVTSKAFLGLTVSCARCHDHKFDPIPTREYYALAGIFRSTVSLIAGGPQPAPNPATLPWYEHPLGGPEETAAVQAYQQRIGELRNAIGMAKQRKRELPGNLTAKELTGIVVDNAQAEVVGRWRSSRGATQFLEKDYIHDGQTNKGTMSVRFTPNLTNAGRYEVSFAYPASFNRATNVPVTIVSAGATNTLLIDQTKPASPTDPFLRLGIFEFAAGTNHAVIVSNTGTKGFVVADAVRWTPAVEPAMMAMTTGTMQPTMKPVPPNPTTPAASGASAALSAMAYEELQKEFVALRAKAPPPLPAAMSVTEGEPQDVAVRQRGDPKNLGAVVPRGVLSVLNQGRTVHWTPPKTSSGRRELAAWIADPTHPLTSRVAVNRIWLHLFGKGLVETPDNFGVLGDLPSHPELLDELASRFVAEGWSQKKLIRQIVLSRAYQQSSASSADGQRIDPENRLLWRANRRRLEGEVLRDSMIFIAGRLDLRQGGSPYGDADATMDDPNIPAPPTVQESPRRSIYLPVQRGNPLDLLQTFDGADPQLVTGKRHVTTTAPQALLLMNSPFVVEQAMGFARELLKAPGLEPGQRVEQAFRMTTARTPGPQLAERSLQFIQARTNARVAAGDSPTDAELKAWQAFAQSLLASSQFRYLD